MASTGTNKIDSNVTGLRYQEELYGCIGVPDTGNDWIALEPNSYDALGGEITTVARNPINAGRQRQKGVVTDLDASGGFNSDLVQGDIAGGLQDILQGFFWADARSKNDVGYDRQPRRAGDYDEYQDYLAISIGSTTDITFDSRVAVSAAVSAGGTGYAVGDIVQVTDANATVNVRLIVTAEAGGVVSAVDLLDVNGAPGGGVEGRTTTDTGAATATTVITGSGNADLTVTVTYGNGLVWQAGDLLWSQGWDDGANNGLLSVASVTNNVVTVNETLVNVTAGSANGNETVTTVGFETSSGDLDVDDSGDFATYTSTALDFESLGLVPGEWIHVGGDTPGSGGDAFDTQDADSNYVNNGFKRIRSISMNALVVDRSSYSMVTEANTDILVRIFFGRVMKNESDPALQRRRSYYLERQLGAPDSTQPDEIQAEYLVGAVSSEVTFTFATADKVNLDVAFIALDNTQIDGPTSLAAGTRRALVSGDVFNTSSDFSRLKMQVHSDTDESPSSLFAYLTEFTLTINNNLSPNKAISVLGAFDITAGNFTVEGSATAYFNTVAGVQAVRNNSDVSLDFTMVKGSSGAKIGMTVDVPLIALGDARLNVEQDAPITLPLDTPAAADRNFDHTLLMVFFDFLPDAADV